MIGISAAMASEVTYFLDRMTNIHTIELAKFPYHHGYLDGKEMVIAQSGVGKVNAAIHAQLLIDRFYVNCIIQSGIAGSLCPSVNTFDMVVGDKLVYHDMQRFILEHFEPLQPVYEATPALLAVAKTLSIASHVGTIATGDWFVDTPEDRARIYKATGALCCEMEGAAVAQTATLNDIDFLVVRCISDSADESINLAFAQFEEEAAIKSGRFVRELLTKLK